MKKFVVAIVTILSIFCLSACSVKQEKAGEYFEGHYTIDAAPISGNYFTDIYVFSDGVSYLYSNFSKDSCVVYDYSYSKDMGYIGFGMGYVAKISDDLKTISFENFTLSKK